MMVTEDSALYHELKFKWQEAIMKKQYFLADQIKHRIKKLKKWQKLKK